MELFGMSHCTLNGLHTLAPKQFFVGHTTLLKKWQQLKLQAFQKTLIVPLPEDAVLDDVNGFGTSLFAIFRQQLDCFKCEHPDHAYLQLPAVDNCQSLQANFEFMLDAREVCAESHE
eukprot:1135654-Rhodomonas_salina.3